MSCFKLMGSNLADQSTLTASSENLLFPKENIQDHRRSKVFRSTSNSTTIIFDLQESSSIDTVFIVADKRSGFGISTATIEFNSTSDFAAPAYSIVVPFSETFGVGYIEFAAISYRFARIVMTSTLGYCELSKIYIGKSLDLVRTINFGWTFKDEEISKKQRNRYNQLFVDVISRQKIINFSMKYVDKLDLDLINKLLDEVGETRPIYLILGDSNMIADNRRFSGPLFLEDIPTISNTNFNKYSFSMSLREMT